MKIAIFADVHDHPVYAQKLVKSIANKEVAYILGLGDYMSSSKCIVPLLDLQISSHFIW